MNRYEMFKVIIDGNPIDYENDNNFKKLHDFLTKIDWQNEQQAYGCSIHFYPTYNLISNQFSFENQNNDSYSDNGTISYDKFLSEEEIKSLSYYDYAGEKLYRLAIQDRPSSDWEHIKPKNLCLITKRLIDYLNENNLTEFHNETLNELKKLYQISEFCLLKNYEIIIIVEF